MVEMVAGEGRYLECEAGGSPPPTIHWMKDGKKVSQVCDYEVIFQNNFLNTTRAKKKLFTCK